MEIQRRQPKVAVLGGGSWGTAVASIVAVSSPTTLWARSAEVAEDIEQNHRNGNGRGNGRTGKRSARKQH